MTTRLVAYMHGARVGAFESVNGGAATFTFDTEWRESAHRLELSLSLPKSRRVHSGAAPHNYLWNLLPDNESVLQRWGATFGVSPRNAMALLAHVGMDTAGALQLSEKDATFLDLDGGWDSIDDTEIGAHIRTLHSDPEAWLLPDQTSGYFSLAGAQSKFALTRTERGWAVPTGRSGSTHIFKPGIRGLPHNALNEHLSMRAARALGFDAASSTIETFDGEVAIVVERYDRHIRADGSVARLHQEDMAQAMGAHPALKYQNEGGPGIHDLAALLQRSRLPAPDIAALFDATLFNWAILGTDAHAKNYSLLHDRALGTRLAPLYDIASALPYPAINDRRAKFAMSFGGHYRQHEVEPRHLLSDAATIGLDPVAVHDRASAIVAGVPDAYSDAVRDAALIGPDRAFADLLVNEAAKRAKRLAKELASVDSGEFRRSGRRSASRPQQRAKDVGAAGNPGAFAPRDD